MFKKIVNSLFWLWIFLIPWQTRWIIKDPMLQGSAWEYGRVSLYAGDIVFAILLILCAVLWFKQKKMARLHALPFVLFICFILWAGLSIFWAADYAVGLYYFARIIQMFFVLAMVRVLKSSFKFIASSLILSGGVQAGFAILQFALQWVPASKWLGLASQEAGNLGTAVIETRSGRFLRAHGSLPHPNILAGFLDIVLLGSLGVYLKNKVGKNWWFWPAWLVVLQALVLSFSRSAWLGLAAALILIIIKLRKHKPALKKIILVCVFSGLLVLANVFVLGDIFSSRVYADTRLETESIGRRQEQTAQAFEIMRKNPLGLGLGNYTAWLQQEHESMPGYFYQPVHNQYLLILAELGFVGLGLFIILLAGFLNKYFKANYEQTKLYFIAFLACAGIIFLFDHYFWTSYTGVLMLGLVFAVLLISRGDEG
ncbi:O-antigen ligase family protein [Patescibacteria group bacterium]|nr:O-antigen ligase family protein [Patescibacteria group bacterium]MBU1922299.1 O-antigen ligase family protein [Patescibacteria group bacterium]